MYKYQTKDDLARQLLEQGTINVASDGTVYKEGRRLAACLNDKDYLYVQIPIGRVRKKFSVHRLVALAYHGFHPDLAVNHIDSNKLNNNADNLEYCTVAENLKHYWSQDDYHSRILLSREQAQEIREMRKMGASVKELADMAGVSQSNIYKLLKNIHWQAPAVL